jgi:hypothetical protein
VFEGFNFLSFIFFEELLISLLFKSFYFVYLLNYLISVLIILIGDNFFNNLYFNDFLIDQTSQLLTLSSFIIFILS